jgi:hypothetical protein
MRGTRLRKCCFLIKANRSEPVELDRWISLNARKMRAHHFVYAQRDTVMT